MDFGIWFGNINESITPMKTWRAETKGLAKCYMYKLRGSMGTLLIWAGRCPFYLSFIFVFMCMSMYLCVLHAMCVQCLQRPEERVRSPETGVSGGCKGTWGLGTKTKSFAITTRALNCWAIISIALWSFPYLTTRCIYSMIIPKPFYLNKNIK